MEPVAVAVAFFAAGVLLGMKIGPSTEERHAIYTDGYIDGRSARQAASGMSAGTAETRSGSGPQDRQPDPPTAGDAQNQSPSNPEIPNG